MKANAPEKIYLNPLLMEDGESVVRRRTFERQRDSQIEYCRTDAFIEKALKFIKTNVDRIVNNQHGVCMGCMDGEFRKYMKGE